MITNVLPRFLMNHSVYFPRPSVCLSVPVLHRPGCNLGNSKECPLVIHNWEDLQLVHRFHYYDNSAEREMSASAADATATPSSLTSLKSRLFEPFWFQHTRIFLDKRPLNGDLSVMYIMK